MVKDLNRLMDAIEGGQGGFVVELARRLWKLQTDDEQEHEVTVYRNDVGYNSADAPWVGKFLDLIKEPEDVETQSKAWAEYRILLTGLRIRMLKYREQLSHLCTDAEVDAALTVNHIS